MTYRHPLAFLLGLEGVALLRAFAGDDFDREFVEARIAETRVSSDQAGGPLARQWCSAAADAAYTGTPAAVIWHFQRADH